MTIIPTRLSIDDPTPDGLRARLRVFVDGDLLRDVIAYDCEAGWIMVVKHDDCGCRVRRGACYLARKVYGSVRVVLT